MSMRIILAGGSGFLGRTLMKKLHAEGHDLVVLSRKPRSFEGARSVVWDGVTLGSWITELEQADAVINLAGRSVNCRYTKSNREAILRSRIDSTRALGAAMAKSAVPPRVWINSSTATIYQHRFDAPNDESTGIIGSHADAHDAFSVDVAKRWEAAFTEALSHPTLARTRGVIIRSAMVFGKTRGGVYEVLRRLVRLGFGGKMATGKQYVSWLHEVDFCRAITWLLEDDSSRHGVYNVCAPSPLTNSEMMQALREAHEKNVGLSAPAWLLAIGAYFLRTEIELVIKSRRVCPDRLITEGFTFQYPRFEQMLPVLESP